MPDQKITELAALTTPDGADLLAIVDDVAGTPITKKITLANLLTIAAGGATTQVQFNNSGALGGSANLTWVGDTLGITATANGTARVAGLGLGVQLVVEAGDGDATHVGGELQLTSGSSIDNNGGDIQIIAGPDIGEGDGGNITIRAGQAVSGDGGELALNGGSSTEDGDGGQVTINGGTSAEDGAGGDVIISAGASTTGSGDGSVQLYDGTGSHSLEVNKNGIFLAGGVFSIDPPTATDPAVNGQLFTCTAAQLAALLAAGAKHVLISKGAP